MLVGIVVFIVMLALWSRKSRKGVSLFYQKYAMFTATDPPQNVRDAIGVKDPMCLKGSLVPNSGGEVPFYWWEWSSSSMISTGQSIQHTISCFLAISFPPNAVSEKFEQIAIREKDAKRSLLKKLKSIYALDFRKPTRVEKLADGAFVIFWQIVQRPEVMEDKITWLKNNLSVPAVTTIPQPSAPQPQPKAPVMIQKSPKPPTNAKAIFYKNCTYAELCRTLSAAWPSLELELHHEGPKLDKEGWDYFDYDAILGDSTQPNDVAFWLTDETYAETAVRLFSDQYGGRAYINRGGYSVETRETIEYCNDPFMLPMNKYSYGEFKRLAVERWPNLTIELYDVSPYHGVLTSGYPELPADFDMTTLTAVGDPLHDYIYICDWRDSLKRGKIGASIKNNRLGTLCSGNEVNQRLKDYEAATA